MSTIQAEETIGLLLVDDDEVDIMNVRRLFTRFGMANRYTLHVARDGQEALTMLRGTDRPLLAPFPEIILLDLNMPRLNGMDFLQELWSAPLSKRPRVIVLSGSDAGEDKQRAILAGAAGYIVKPITLPQFVEAISIFNQ